MCARWSDEKLGVDGYHAGNELRYINDYRTDILSFDDDTKQTKSPNVEVTQVYVDGLPHVILITSKAITKHTEFLCDYGDDL
jgi:hypothetical protein